MLFKIVLYLRIEIKQSLNRAKAMIKKRILPFLFLLSLLLVFTQCNFTHLRFEGIPIDGPIEPFVQKLKEKGFKPVEKWEEMQCLKGTFAGKSNCQVFVLRNVKRDVVYRVVVCMPFRDNWEQIERDYQYLQRYYIKKLGAPDEFHSNFEVSREVERDEDKWKLLCADKCNYTSTWEVDGGKIYLEMSHIEDENENCVRVLFYDKVNDVVSEDYSSK